jgi:hypothetical protein
MVQIAALAAGSIVARRLFRLARQHFPRAAHPNREEPRKPFLHI